MGRNRKIVLIVSAVVVVIALVLAIVFAGKIISNKPLGNNGDKQAEQTGQGTGVESTGTGESTPQKQEESTTKPEESKFKGIKVKAVYLSGNSARSSKTLDKIIQMVNTTELNAVVVDVKEAGMVNYQSKVPAVVSNGAISPDAYDPEAVLKKLHDNNIYVIGRIVCFRDNVAGSKNPDLAVRRPGGTVWKEGTGKNAIAWLNPYKEENWQYNIDIAKEAADLGFDEIQFDYVRFPTGKKGDFDYGTNPASKTDTISKYLETAKKQISGEKGIPVTADVFGIVIESKVDGEAIGQELEKVGKDIDYICPMIYPSHYANAGKRGKVAMGNGVGQSVNGVVFTAPDLKPYEVVYNTLMKAKTRISTVQGYNANVRPYLQAFTASYIKDKNYYQAYGPQQIRQQIKAVYDAGYEEWILWNSGNIYDPASFEKDAQ